jgi:hypothetical protein
MNEKITVTIETRANLLRLRWNDGKRRSLTLGLRDTPPNKAVAIGTKKLIENNWADGKYDGENLLPYRPQITGSNASDITALELFKKFKQHKLKCADISTTYDSQCFQKQ